MDKIGGDEMKKPATNGGYVSGEWDMFNLLTSCEYGKQCYFLQDNGIVYSRRSHTYMTFDDAVEEFITAMGWGEY